MTSNSKILDLLECPVCKQWMYPPIYQCPNGHTICIDCKVRVDNCCPVCRQDLGNIRCLALDKLAEVVDLPCRYLMLGCQATFPCISRLEHEKNCSFAPYYCPQGETLCRIKGDVQSLFAHLTEDHEVNMLNGCAFKCQYVITDPPNVGNASWMLTVINCFNCHFCLHFESFHIGPTPAYIAFLHFMGDDDEAKRFSYSLEVEGNGRKNIWRGVPRSIRDSPETVRDSLDGLIIHRRQALFFSDGDGQKLLLNVAGCIWYEQSQVQNAI